MKVNILGTDYKILKDTPKNNSKLVNAAAYVEFQTKEIVLDAHKYDKEHNLIKDYDRFKRKVLRHEIVHAFLFESGLEDLAGNEVVVDWIANQFPKLHKAFKQLGVEE